jgi:hypothetical protein
MFATKVANVTLISVNFLLLFCYFSHHNLKNVIHVILEKKSSTGGGGKKNLKKYMRIFEEQQQTF